LRFPIPNYAITYSLGLIKWGEHPQQQQVFAKKEATYEKDKCDVDWTYPREAWPWNRTDSPILT